MSTLLKTLADEPPRNAAADLSWPAVTREAKPWVRWWWMGSAVDKPNLTRELEQLQSHGFGGVEVTPLYGATGFEDRYIDFLSPKWMEMLEFTGAEANRLDMGVDMATGTGWPFGGPWITPDDADAQIVPDASKLVEKPTRMKVKRAAPGGEGWVVNPFSAHAMQAYLKPFDAAFAQFPRDLIRSQFHDSFEYSGNWSHELPAKFKDMHGYDLADHAKELWGNGDDDANRRVASDYRETLGQMHLDYLKVWVKWCHDHGMLARNQAHGSPGNLLDLYAVADICETETFGSTPFHIPGFRRDENEIRSDSIPNPQIARFASSAAHVAGRQLASCETFTWLREHFRTTLSEMKPEADQMFLVGINHLIYHGSCYSPEDAQWPGWNFYASVEFNARNSIWRDVPAMNAYYTRVQSILQSGKPDNDLLVYWPIFDVFDEPVNGNKPNINFTVHNAFLDHSSLGKAAEWMNGRGYSFDYVSDAQLGSMDQLDRYRAIVIPRCHTMPVATLQKLIALAQGGATVIFEDALPTDVPGLGDLQNRQAAMHDALAKAQTLVDGKRIIIGKLDAALQTASIGREAMADSGLQFVRQSFDGGYHYFIANLTAKAIEGWMPLAVKFASAAILDPLTGNTGLAATKEGAVYLQLQPGESTIIRTFDTRQIQSPPYSYFAADGASVDVSGNWKIDFIEGGPKLPASITTDKLDSWTTLGDDEAKRFAGTGRYTLEFTAPDTKADDWLLNLGDVRESARVTINGQSVGTLWSLPFQIRVGSFIKPGKNKLEIEVTNLAANRIRDLDARKVEWKKFHEINFVNIHYQPFDASTWDLTPSGLLEPVKLIPMKKVQP